MGRQKPLARKLADFALVLKKILESWSSRIAQPALLLRNTSYSQTGPALLSKLCSPLVSRHAEATALVRLFLNHIKVALVRKTGSMAANKQGKMVCSQYLATIEIDVDM